MSVRTAPMPATAEPKPWFRDELISFLQILGLATFAVTQPVLDVMGKSPETFVFRGAGTGQILLFAGLVAVVPAMVLTFIGASTRSLGPSVRLTAHRVTVWLLAALFGIQVVKKLTSFPAVPVLVAGVAVGSLLTLLFVRSSAARMWLRYAALAAPLSLLVFVLISPVSKLVLPNRSGTSAQHAAPIPVVFMLFDQLPLESLIDRTGKLNAELFPNFAGFAKHSTWYRNYTAIEPHTGFAVPTMLSGTVATDRTKEPLAVDYPNNLFSLLEKTHRLEVFEVLTRLCSGACSDIKTTDDDETGFVRLLSDAWTVWSDLSLPVEVQRDVQTQFTENAGGGSTGNAPRPAGRGRGAQSGRQRFISRVDSFLDSFKRGERPTLHYLHLLLPHLPWHYFPSGSQYQTLKGHQDDLPLTRGKLPWAWLDQRWPLQLARERHLLQLKFADRLLGQAIKKMRVTGVYDDALIVITSDHGLSIQPGRSRGPTQDNMHEIYWVPLLVKQPHQATGILDGRNLMSTDLLPTIADSLRTEVPWRTDGRSALDPRYDRGPVKTIVRRWERLVPWPQRTLSLRIAEAWRRMRSEAFRPPSGCEPAMCLYRVGPGASAIGEPMNRYVRGAPLGVSVKLDLPVFGQLRAEEGAPFPALVWGTLDGSRSNPGDRVAVTVQGRIGGVSTIWSENGQRFGMLIPEHLIRQGGADLDFFLLRGSTLHPMSRQAP